MQRIFKTINLWLHMKTQIYILFLVGVALLATGCEPQNQPAKSVGFSISSEKRILFSPGNLQYRPVTHEWRFAEYQYDYVGNKNLPVSESSYNWIDLFGWGTGLNPTFTSNQWKEYNTFIDWGVVSINGDPQDTWRTLTAEEWEYLILKRPHAAALLGVAQVNGINGLILLPDYWERPKDIVFTSGMNWNYSGYDGGYADYQSFTFEQWTSLELSGAVFLPAAGMRVHPYGVQQPTIRLDGIQTCGNYWSSSRDGNDAVSLYFDSEMVGISHIQIPSKGLSVRLVKEL